MRDIHCTASRCNLLTFSCEVLNSAPYHPQIYVALRGKSVNIFAKTQRSPRSNDEVDVGNEYA